MARQLFRTGLVLGIALAAAMSPARAQEPKTRTIRVVECVPEKVQETRKVCRIECRQEVYETTRCEKVAVVKERVVNVVNKVPVYNVEVRKVCCPVWTWEEKVCMKPCWETRQVTCMQKKCVSKGYWDTCEKETFLSKFGGLLRKDKDCCDDCDPRCPKTKCKKVWVNCPQYVDCPVTKCQKVCVMKQEVCKVKVCRTEVKQVEVKTCSWRCETTQRVEKYTCWETRQVPCKATRTVRVPVQVEEQVWVTRMVPREREVQVADTCCSDSCCNDDCGPRRRLSLRDRLRKSGCCH